MKWETLKNNVARSVYSKIKNAWDFDTNALILLDGAKSDTPVTQESIQTYADKAYDIVMNWDIRAINRLREVFKNFFPKKFATGTLRVEMNENCEWVVYKA